jgi:hypothetical protein
MYTPKGVVHKVNANQGMGAVWSEIEPALSGH